MNQFVAYLMRILMMVFGDGCYIFWTLSVISETYVSDNWSFPDFRWKAEQENLLWWAYHNMKR